MFVSSRDSGTRRYAVQHLKGKTYDCAGDLHCSESVKAGATAERSEARGRTAQPPVQSTPRVTIPVYSCLLQQYTFPDFEKQEEKSLKPVKNIRIR